MSSMLVQMVEDCLGYKAKKQPIRAKQWPNQKWKLLDECIRLLLFFLLALIPAEHV